VRKQQQDQIRGTGETYDRSAESFHRVWATLSMADKLARFQQVPPEGARRVSDTGCGSGGDVRWLLERGFDVVGGDLSPCLLGIARQNAPCGRFVRLDLRHLPLASGCFDGVWACASPAPMEECNGT